MVCQHPIRTPLPHSISILIRRMYRWISGAGDPRCKVYIVLGKTDPNHPDKYKQQSIIIVPTDTPGITIKRMLSVYGYDDAPHGHAHIVFKNVRVPAENIVLGESRGFEVMQGRMGPGRIHHAMRSIGAVCFSVSWHFGCRDYRTN